MKKLLAILLCCVSGLLMAYPGKWDVSTQHGLLVTWNNQPILSRISLDGFVTDYSKRNLCFNPTEVLQREDGIRLEDPGSDAYIDISFGENTMTIDMEVLVTEETKLEFGIWTPYKTLCAEDGTLVISVDGKSSEVGEKHFGNQTTRRLGLESPRFSNVLEAQRETLHFFLQDKREECNGLVRYIGTKYVKEDLPARISTQVVWTIQEFDEDAQKDRMAILWEHRIERHPMTIENPGFEEGKAGGWHFASNASLETDPVHGMVARLDVSDPMKDTVYITRHIPVEAGAWYEATLDVKTEEVQPVDGKMPSVGAGLIIEWADANKKWLAAGEYSCNRFITSDWAPQIMRAIRAPEGASYACIFLALRGTGTAWFDNLTMTHVDQKVVKTAPYPGATFHCNVPELSWEMTAGVRTYSVQLSLDPAFPEDATRTYDVVAANRLVVPEPLDAGTWYWRVNAMGLPDTRAWRFIQTAEASEDCEAPVIQANAKRILSSDAGMYDFLVTDNTDANPVVTVTDTQNRAYRLEKNGNACQAIPEEGWADGLTTLVITAKDQDGNASTQNAWVLNAPKPERVIAIDEQGRYTENGKVIFPLGIYQVDEEDMDEVRDSGFEVVHIYTWESSQDEAGCARYLDACVRHGLRAFIGFDRGNGSQNGMVQGNFACIANRVGAQAAHPGLFCWYLFDEPELAHQYISPELMIRYADLVRTLDPYHPVVLTTWNSTMKNYRSTWDTHWTQSYSTPDKISAQIDEHRRFLDYDSPITLLAHCYDREQSKNLKAGLPVDFNNFSPRYEQLKAAAFVGIAKEVNGLFWWWYAKRDKVFLSASKDPRCWDDVRRAIQEIREFREVLTAEGAVQSGQVDFMSSDGKRPTPLLWWVKELSNGTRVGLLVNTDNEEKSGVVELPGFGQIEFDLPGYGVQRL